MKHLQIAINDLPRIKLSYPMLTIVILLCMTVLSPASAFWRTVIAAQGNIQATVIGISSSAHDGYDGSGPLIINPNTSGVLVQLYREHGPDWGGTTGFYAEDYELTPIAPGGNKTWWDFYLWSQNYTPNPPNQIEVRNWYEYVSPPHSETPPDGYLGHLVIDQIPLGVTWTGPMDYWFDMTKYNTFAFPIATVTDPLQGTRFHLTVYAPVPEPSSLAALCVGLAPLILRRRR